MTDSKNRYGFAGWREFNRNRLDILREVERSKDYNLSHPVQTEHGKAGEAAFREWLRQFLPAKYGVVPGYIIPDVISKSKINLYRFDVIIYDALNAPTLWVDGNADTSEKGRYQAIPAKYVSAVFECKASLDERSAKNAVAKIEELHDIRNHLDESRFFSQIIFFELKEKSVNKANILPSLIPTSKTIGYAGGSILYCDLDAEMTGVFKFLTQDYDSNTERLFTPIAKNLEDLEVGVTIPNAEGPKVTMSDINGGLAIYRGPDSQWHFNRIYSITLPIEGEGVALSLTWSRNGFAEFAIDLLLYLEGKGDLASKNLYRFGQSFERIENIMNDTKDS